MPQTNKTNSVSLPINIQSDEERQIHSKKSARSDKFLKTVDPTRTKRSKRASGKIIRKETTRKNAKATPYT